MKLSKQRVAYEVARRIFQLAHAVERAGQAVMRWGFDSAR